MANFTVHPDHITGSNVCPICNSKVGTIQVNEYFLCDDCNNNLNDNVNSEQVETQQNIGDPIQPSTLLSSNTKQQSKNMNPVLLIFIIFISIIIWVAVIAKYSDEDSNSPNNGLSYSVSKNVLDNSVNNMLERGMWNEALTRLKSIKKSDELYTYAQKKLNRLIKGNRIFGTQRGHWKCRFADGEVTTTHHGLNTASFRSKFTGNTWYIRPILSPNWQIDRRFVDYLDNGHLKVVGFLEDKIFDRFEIYK